MWDWELGTEVPIGPSGQNSQQASRALENSNMHPHYSALFTYRVLKMKKQPGYCDLHSIKTTGAAAITSQREGLNNSGEYSNYHVCTRA